jgi:hypothetical protein
MAPGFAELFFLRTTFIDERNNIKKQALYTPAFHYLCSGVFLTPLRIIVLPGLSTGGFQCDDWGVYLFVVCIALSVTNG